MYTFRAWIDEWGFNVDHHHRHSFGCQLARPRHCEHLRMADWETNGCRMLGRVIRRRHPFYFAIVAFFRAHRGTTLLRIGRKP